jgi:hypothetical protein
MLCYAITYARLSIITRFAFATKHSLSIPSLHYQDAIMLDYRQRYAVQAYTCVEATVLSRDGRFFFFW